MYEKNPREICIKRTYLNREVTNYFIYFLLDDLYLLNGHRKYMHH